MIDVQQPTGDHPRKGEGALRRGKDALFKLDREIPARIGLGRFVKIVVGWGAPTSQEVAANCLMLLGFVIEGIILWQVVLEQATKDIGRTSLPILPFLFWLVPVVIFFLLFHQFAIFRNFALPREAAHRLNRVGLETTIADAIQSLEQQTPPASISALAKLKSRPQWSDEQVTWRKRVEIVLYALFGVLTGEAGYMLTLLHEHNTNNMSAAFVLWLFDTKGQTWGRTLECVFLTCAMVICLGVLLWDLA